jgi:hypothetical protein
LVGMLVVGLICNLLVKPIDQKWFMTDTELAAEKKLAHEKMIASEVGSANASNSSTVSPAVVAIAWLAVGLPLAWGIYRTLLSVAKFFA